MDSMAENRRPKIKRVDKINRKEASTDATPSRQVQICAANKRKRTIQGSSAENLKDAERDSSKKLSKEERRRAKRKRRNMKKTTNRQESHRTSLPVATVSNPADAPLAASERSLGAAGLEGSTLPVSGCGSRDNGACESAICSPAKGGQPKRRRRKRSNVGPNSQQPAPEDIPGDVGEPCPRDRPGGDDPVIAKLNARYLAKALEIAKKKHREEHGKGTPLAGMEIEAFAGSVFGVVVQLSRAARPEGGTEADEADQEAAEMAAMAVAASAEKEHLGQISVPKLEALITTEAVDFSSRRRANMSLQRALVQEQNGYEIVDPEQMSCYIVNDGGLADAYAGNLVAAESECAACLAAWPKCASGHLKMAQILRAAGSSQQRAIRDAEFHFRQALAHTQRDTEWAGPGGESVARAAGESLSLLLAQEGRDKEAAGELKRLGFRYRLSRRVLRYPLAAVASASTMDMTDPSDKRNTLRSVSTAAVSSGSNDRGGAGGGGQGTWNGRRPRSGGCEGRRARTERAPKVVAAFDDALPPAMLRHLQVAFGGHSRFWTEHGYNSETGTPGYFSYIHNLKDAPTTSIEDVIQHVKVLAERSFPEVKEANFVEWWAHRRPHSSGHQMHFDSDNEGRGGVRNPIVSAVVYVTGNVGGPTLVTSQRLASKRLAEGGWIVHPRRNRLCLFDGGVLHGVIPGRGVPASARRGGGSERGTVPPVQQESRMRVTWMVAFWREIRARKRAVGVDAGVTTPSGVGAAQPFPDAIANRPGQPAETGLPTWPRLFRTRARGWGESEGVHVQGAPVEPVPIPQIWEDVDLEKNKLAGETVQRLRRLPAYDVCFQGF